MYKGEILKNNNLRFYLYRNARDRQQRTVEYQQKHVGAKMVFNYGPQQMRIRSCLLYTSDAADD